MKMNNKLILALDVEDLTQAKYFINKLYPEIKIFKVGSVLFTAYGPKVIDLIHKKGAEVFLDLKYHDIPNTVANAVRQAVRLKVKMLTLHISGGKEMLELSVQAAKDEAAYLKIKKPLLIGITVLTSQEVNKKEVMRLAKEGLACGLDGVVCSVREAAVLRAAIKKDFLIITPGIRSSNALVDDQKRVATAQEALRAGSDFLVVGRPILKAVDPFVAARDFFKE